MQKVGRSADDLVNPGGALETANRDGDGPLTINQIGVVDPLMREYLQQKRLLEAELERLRTGGAMEANPRHSGSVLGSIEAAMVAPEVDGVILTVTRGQQQPLVEKTVRHLGAIGGKIVGTVFNRAKFMNVRTSIRNSKSPLLPAPPPNGSQQMSGEEEEEEAPPAEPNGQEPAGLAAGWSPQKQGLFVLAPGMYDYACRPADPIRRAPENMPAMDVHVVRLPGNGT